MLISPMGYKGTKKYRTPDLVIELIELTKKLGRIPQTREFGDGKSTHITRRFGKWINAIEHIGAWPSKDDLIFYYSKQGLSCDKICKLYPPLTKVTMRNLCKRYKIKMRKHSDYEMPSGENHPLWSGGRFIDSLGYVLVREPRGKSRHEHRIIMENKIGRKLLTNEHVHHINGVRHDNRPENLCVLEKSKHHAEGRTLAKHQFKRIQELEAEIKRLKH